MRRAAARAARRRGSSITIVSPSVFVSHKVIQGRPGEHDEECACRWYQWTIAIVQGCFLRRGDETNGRAGGQSAPFSQEDRAKRASGTTVVLPAPGGACRVPGRGMSAGIHEEVVRDNGAR